MGRLHSTGCNCAKHDVSGNRREVLALGLGAATGLTATAARAQGPVKAPPYYGVFRELPVGAVKPKGWIKAWLQRQAEGMTGHPENLAYPYDTVMLAGKIPPPAKPHGEDWWPYEQTAYFVDGATRLAAQIDAPNVDKIARLNLGYVTRVNAPGKLGESTWGWPNAIIGRALMARHDATGDEASANALRNFLQPDRHMGSRDGFVAEQAFYLYSKTGEPALLDQGKRLYEQFFTADARSFSHESKIRDAAPFREHGVTAAEQLKIAPLYYCHSGDAAALDLARVAYDKALSGSLMADGGLVSSENLGAPAFNSLHETCDITDWSWSLGYMLMAGGEGRFADVIEKATFNALPGAVTKDFRQLQYFSSANQVLASSTACPRISPARMSYRAAHDTECCSGNVNRAMPNYVARMWMQTPEGLAATLYGPSVVTAKVGGRTVTVTQATDYPFRDTIVFTISTRRPNAFPLQLRIPQWAEGATITVNGKPSGITATPGVFAVLRREFRDGDRIELKLPMQVRTRDWFGGEAVSIERGPLVYSLAVEEERVELTKDIPAVQGVLKGNNIQGFPAIEFYPAGEWRYGVAASAKMNAAAFKAVEGPLGANPFAPGATPVRIEVPLRPLPQWEAAWTPKAAPGPIDFKTTPKNPLDLPTADQRRAAGEARVVALKPYGSTHLRLTTLPVIPA